MAKKTGNHGPSVGSVEYKKKDYVSSLIVWDKIDDVCAGEKAVKAGREKYLPLINPDDNSHENMTRYNQYLLRASFFNATGRTLDGLLGMVFKNDPIVEFSSEMKFLENDVDGAGTLLNQQARFVTSENIKKGRIGLFTDYPAIEGEISIGKQEEIKPFIKAIPARNIVNWKVKEGKGKKYLSLVVIKEEYEKDEQQTGDYFSENIGIRYRVLRLVSGNSEVADSGKENKKSEENNTEGEYRVEIWEQAEGGFKKTKTYIPKDANGKTWEEIPFIFVGSINNDPEIDPPPLYDLAELNLAHYRNSADYEDSCFFCGQVQPWISGLTEDWRDYLENQGLIIGSRTPVLLPEKGSFGFEQANPNTLVGEAMDKKESQMVSLGSRLLQQGQRVKTATEAQGELEEDSSILASISINVSEAYSKSIGWVSRFLSGDNIDPDSNKYELSKKFFDKELDSASLTSIVQAWQSGLLPVADAWNYLKKYDVIDKEKSEESIKDELENDSVLERFLSENNQNESKENNSS